MAATNASGAETHAIKNPDSAQHNQRGDETAEVVGRNNGRTAIGSSASDTGAGITAEKANQTMAQLGLDKVQIGLDKGPMHIDDKQIGEILKHLKEPTDQERKDAQGKLDGQVSKLLSPEDQKTLGDMQKSVLSGDSKSFGENIAKFKDNPEKLKAFIDEMNKNLKQSGSDTRAEVDSQGNVILHNGGDTGVVFNKDGKSTVHEITHRPEGGVVVGGEIVGGKKVDDVMKEIGDGTVKDITGPHFNPGWLRGEPRIGGPLLHSPEKPEWPGSKLPVPGINYIPDGRMPPPIPVPDERWPGGGGGKGGHVQGIGKPDDIILMRNGVEKI